jgi:hypothetical protein
VIAGIYVLPDSLTENSADRIPKESNPQIQSNFLSHPPFHSFKLEKMQIK